MMVMFRNDLNFFMWPPFRVANLQGNKNDQKSLKFTKLSIFKTFLETRNLSSSFSVKILTKATFIFPVNFLKALKLSNPMLQLTFFLKVSLLYTRTRQGKRHKRL